jgi:PmbA protein
MLGETNVKELANQVLALSKADQTEVIVSATESALTRFANSYIHQNVAETDTQVRVRVVYGKKIGVASSNDLSPDALKRTVETARAIAQLQREDPEFKSLPSPQPIQKVDAFIEQTASCTPEQRAQVVGVLCKRAKAQNVVAAGAFSTTTNEVAVANSLGVFAYHPGTYADISTVMMTNTGSGYASFTHQDARQVNAEAIAQTAIDKAIRASNPVALEPGEYTVFLEEYAVLDLLNLLAMTGFSAQALQEDRSFMKGKLGEKVMDERVTIWDDALADYAPGSMPFDGEGVPTQRLAIFEKGVFKNYVFDLQTAGIMGCQSTGSAMRSARGQPMPGHANLRMAAGTASGAEMLRGIKRGVLVDQVLGGGQSNVLAGEFSVNLDLGYLIENGEIVGRLKDTMIAGNVFDAFNNIRSIGRELEWHHSEELPPICFEALSVAGGKE